MNIALKKERIEIHKLSNTYFDDLLQERSMLLSSAMRGDEMARKRVSEIDELILPDTQTTARKLVKGRSS